MLNLSIQSQNMKRVSINLNEELRKEFLSYGDKHSNSKVKTIAAVDVDRINNINKLAETVANNGRLEQIAQTTFDLLNGGEYDVKKLGDFIKNVMKDIAKEDLDTIAASGYTMKEISGPVSKICREHVMTASI